MPSQAESDAQNENAPGEFKVCQSCQKQFSRRHKERDGQMRYTESVQAYATRSFCSRPCAKLAYVKRKLPRNVTFVELTRDEMEDIRAQHEPPRTTRSDR